MLSPEYEEKVSNQNKGVCQLTLDILTFKLNKTTRLEGTSIEYLKVNLQLRLPKKKNFYCNFLNLCLRNQYCKINLRRWFLHESDYSSGKKNIKNRLNKDRIEKVLN